MTDGARATERRRSEMSRAGWLAAFGFVLALAVCAVQAAETARFILVSGLFAQRLPLSGFQTAVRLAGVVAAAGLVAVRRDMLERVTLLFGVAAMGSSALYGVGVRSDALSAARLIFHFFAYAFGASVLARMLVLARLERP